MGLNTKRELSLTRTKNNPKFILVNVNGMITIIYGSGLPLYVTLASCTKFDKSNESFIFVGDSSTKIIQ